MTTDFPIRLEQPDQPQAGGLALWKTGAWPAGTRQAITGVTAAGAGASSFQVAEDQTADLVVGQTLRVSGSSGNDGLYTLRAGSSFAGGTTTIHVAEAVPDATADGALQLTLSYPHPGQSPTKYPAKRLAAAGFDGTTLDDPDYTEPTDSQAVYDVLFNLAGGYVEPGAIVLAEYEGGRWWIVRHRPAPGRWVYTGGDRTTALGTHQKRRTGDLSVVWSADFGSTVHALVPDTAGNLYVGGEPDASGLYLAKYDADGNLLWTAPADEDEEIRALALISTGELLVGTGFGPSPGPVTNTLRLYDTAGNRQWSVSGYGPIFDFAADTAAGLVYVCNGDLLVVNEADGSVAGWNGTDEGTLLPLTKRGVALTSGGQLWASGHYAIGSQGQVITQIRRYNPSTGVVIADYGTRMGPASSGQGRGTTLAADNGGNLWAGGRAEDHHLIKFSAETDPVRRIYSPLGHTLDNEDVGNQGEDTVTEIRGLAVDDAWNLYAVGTDATAARGRCALLKIDRLGRLVAARSTQTPDFGEFAKALNAVAVTGADTP